MVIIFEFIRSHEIVLGSDDRGISTDIILLYLLLPGSIASDDQSSIYTDIYMRVYYNLQEYFVFFKYYDHKSPKSSSTEKNI